MNKSKSKSWRSTARIESSLNDLNPEQISAVTHNEGPLLTIAGAGTGKTTVITRRIAYLIDNKKAKPGEILALTFTDKAANEMESRVDVLVPYGYIDVLIATFHAFGDRVLRDHALDLHLRSDYKVMTFPEQVVFFREHWHEFPLKYYRSLSDPTRHISALLTAISRIKDEDITEEDYLRWAKRNARTDDGKRQLELAQIYKKYQELKAKKGFIDFGDQVTLALRLFREKKAVLKRFQEKFKYILVDEFQDTNYAQFELIKLLAGKRKNIMVVGDDDQSIYKFRGAAISNILNFEKVYKKHKKVVLIKNYRSTQPILDAAYRLIKHNNPDRLEIRSKIDKKLVSVAGLKEKIAFPSHMHFDNVATEADWTAREIQKQAQGGKYKLSDFAVLLRANADAEPFCQSLSLLGIPYVFSGGGGLYSFPEVKLAVSFLNVLGDLADSVALYALALSDVYRLSPLDLQKINTFAKRRNFTLYHVFSNIEKTGIKGTEFDVLSDLKEGSIAAIRRILEDVKYYLEFAKTRTTGEVLYQFLKRSDFLGHLTKNESEQNEEKLRHLAKFFDKIKEFNAVADIDRVAEFVKYLDLLKEAGEDPASGDPDTDCDAVNIMTVHKAKGLEFAVVFMAALVADKFPTRERHDAIEIPQGLIKEILPAGNFHLQEERRLFYVGMTRAKEKLYFTSAVSYFGKRDRKISQFVLEALDRPKAAISPQKKKSIDQIELFAPCDLSVPPVKLLKPDEALPLSYYLIDDYLTCPLKYKYVHVLNVPLLPSHTIMYGSALHRAAQAYFSAKQSYRKFSEKDIHHIFLDNWSPQGFISREHEEARLKAGKLALKRFFAKQKKSDSSIKCVEEGFKILKDKIQIKGRFDLVLESRTSGRGSRVFIVDFKSSEVKDQETADKKAKESVQLGIYALAWKEMFGKMPDGLQLYFFESGLTGACQKNGDDLIKLWQKIRKTADAIRSADYHATPNPIRCGYCPYSELCPSSAV